MRGPQRPSAPARQASGTKSLETVEDGKARLLVGDLLPAHVEGDRLPAAFDRRAFLQTAVAVSAIAAAGGVVRQTFGGSAAAAQRADISIPKPATPAPALASGTSLDVPGISPFLTSNKDFYRVDTALRVPDVPIDGFNLRIHGMVDKELNLSFEDLLSRKLIEKRITLTCVSNPVGGKYLGNATWIGIPIRDLLEEAGVKAGADAVKSTSADNMTIGTPLQALNDANRDAILAVAMNGEPLPLEHGFPVRMVVPGLYGYVSATKWLVDLEVTRFADFKAYWSTRGYSVKAPIKTSSRIDVPKSFAQVKAGEKTIGRRRRVVPGPRHQTGRDPRRRRSVAGSHPRRPGQHRHLAPVDVRVGARRPARTPSRSARPTTPATRRPTSVSRSLPTARPAGTA